MSQRRSVLVVDDEAFVRDSLVAVLADAGFEGLAASGVSPALELLARREVHAVLLDLHMPEGGGLALLRTVRERGWEVPVVVITGAGTISHAVEAMRSGADDFVLKPIEPKQLVLLVERAIDHRRLQRDVRRLRHLVQGEPGDSRLIGRSPALDALRALVAQVAPTDATVLVTGESGTGKELVAEEIHARSRRAGRNLVRVNCAAIPDTLFESEFFGHRRGAFSGAVADRVGRFAEAEGGTLVLDEIGTLKPEMQAKLLRVLESGEYQVVGESVSRTADVRIVAVTNEPLAERVREGHFRADLYYRVAIFPIEVPPLREHKQDIPAIAAHLLARMVHGPVVPAGAEERCRPDPEAIEVLSCVEWPGNVRELRNVLERALILCGGAIPDAGTLGQLLEASAGRSTGTGGELHLRTCLDAREREVLRLALERSGGKRKDAAQLLGIDARNMGYYLRKHGMADVLPSPRRGNSPP